MLFLIQRLTRNWRAGNRARLLYVGMTFAFVALAVVGIVAANYVVAVTASLVAIVTMIAAAVAPRLSG